MTKNISVTIEEELLNYIDDLAKINGRTRSGMISWLIKQSKEQDDDLDKDYYSHEYGTIEYPSVTPDDYKRINKEI